MKQVYFLLVLLLVLILPSALQAQTNVPYDSLRLELEGMYERDQGIRAKVSTTQPEEMNALFAEIHDIDSVNQIQVSAILSKYGWLPQSKVGEKATDALFYVVQHARSAMMAEYLPALKKSAQEGEAKKHFPAMMEDRLLMFQGKKQLYGTQATSMLREDGSMVIWPVKGSKKVNKRRKEAGFTTTVEENAARLQADYNPKEALPKNSHKF